MFCQPLHLLFILCAKVGVVLVGWGRWTEWGKERKSGHPPTGGVSPRWLLWLDPHGGAVAPPTLTTDVDTEGSACEQTFVFFYLLTTPL